MHLLVVYMILGLINERKMEYIRKTEISQSDRYKLTSTGAYLTKYLRSFQTIIDTVYANSETNNRNISQIRFLILSAEGKGTV